MDVTLFRLSIAFTLVTGTGAGVLAALSWGMLRESPLGTTLGLLAAVMSIATLYHGGLLVAGSETPVLETLLVLGYVLVAVALAAAISEVSRDGWHTPAWGHRFVLPAAIGGLLLYAVVGPLSEVFFPSMLHWIHGFAALSAIAGLYSPVHDDLQDGSGNERDPSDAVDGRDPLDAVDCRERAEWMVPMDDAILEVLYDSELVLTPAVVAYNLDRSREEVNRRLGELASAGFVERLERGKYRLADRGRRHLVGDVETSN